LAVFGLAADDGAVAGGGPSHQPQARTAADAQNGDRPLGPKPRTTKPAPGHKIFPYLLRNLTIDRPNQVWAADITYLPIGRGFLYLVAVIDWASRAVLSWRLSNTMDVAFCVSALEEALARFGKPEIFNTDQGSQFTSTAFTGVLSKAGVKLSMDGRGRWLDNVFVERLWRSLKHEDVYLKGYADGGEVKIGIATWFAFYNSTRPHQALGNRTPMTVWREGAGGGDVGQGRAAPHRLRESAKALTRGRRARNLVRSNTDGQLVDRVGRQRLLEPAAAVLAERAEGGAVFIGAAWPRSPQHNQRDHSIIGAVGPYSTLITQYCRLSSTRSSTLSVDRRS
jgi:putative transposase